MVDTTQYEASHGKAPRGIGYWAFQIGDEEWFYGCLTSYSNAKKAAQVIANQKKVITISVLP